MSDSFKTLGGEKAIFADVMRKIIFKIILA